MIFLEEFGFHFSQYLLLQYKEDNFKAESWRKWLVNLKLIHHFTDLMFLIKRIICLRLILWIMGMSNFLIIFFSIFRANFDFLCYRIYNYKVLKIDLLLDASITEEDARSEPHVAMRPLIAGIVIMKLRCVFQFFDLCFNLGWLEQLIFCFLFDRTLLKSIHFIDTMFHAMKLKRLAFSPW